MILVMPDANALLQDRHLRSPLLRQLQSLLRSHPEDVRAAVTEVVLAETVANHHREIDTYALELKKLATKHRLVRSPVGPEVVSVALDELQHQRDSYEGILRKQLNEFGFEVLGYPEVEHAELVARATQRRPPNNTNGDGYRDTLNWFSVMQEASQLVRDDEVVWVSADTDFAENGELRALLLDDLHAREIECPVNLIGTMDAAIDRLQERVDPEHKDTARVRAKLRPQRIKDYICQHALRDLPAVAVTPRDLALPLTAQDPRIVAQWDPEGEPDTVISGAVQGGARVRALCDVLVLIHYTDPVTTGPSLGYGAATGDASEVVGVRKKIRVTIDVLADRDANPQAAEIVRVTATPDDRAEPRGH